MAEYTINVTEEDIEKGIKNNSVLCPIARAAKRTFDEKNVVVGLLRLHINLDSQTEPTITFSLPDEAWRFIESFDDGQPVKPISFTVIESS